MLSKQKKKEAVESLSGIVKGQDSVIFVDFAGLSMSEISDLKGQIRESGSQLKVVKKSLLPFVWKKSNIASVDLGDHKGSVAFVYGEEESIGTAKSVTKFSKSHERLVVLGGLFNDDFFGPDRVKDLADLPSKEELVGKLMYLLNPAGSLVRVLSSPVSGLVGVISNIKDKN